MLHIKPSFVPITVNNIMLADLVLLSFQLVLGQLQSFKIIESWTPSCPKFVSYLIFQSLSNPNVLKPRIFLKSSHQITQIPPNIPCLVALSLKFSQVHVTMVNLLATAWQQTLCIHQASGAKEIWLWIVPRIFEISLNAQLFCLNLQEKYEYLMKKVCLHCKDRM